MDLGGRTGLRVMDALFAVDSDERPTRVPHTAVEVPLSIGAGHCGFPKITVGNRTQMHVLLKLYQAVVVKEEGASFSAGMVVRLKVASHYVTDQLFAIIGFAHLGKIHGSTAPIKAAMRKLGGNFAVLAKVRFWLCLNAACTCSTYDFLYICACIIIGYRKCGWSRNKKQVDHVHGQFRRMHESVHGPVGGAYRGT